MALIERGALTVSWDGVIAGREAKALATFAKTLQYHEKLEKQGRIDGSRVFFAVTGKGRGQVVMVGRLEELSRVLTDDEFTANLQDAGLVATGIEVTLWAGGAPDTISGAMSHYTEQLQEQGLL